MRSSRRLRQRERDELRRIVRAADGDDDVLLAVVQVRHRRAVLADAEIDRPERLAGRLVERLELRAADVRRRARRALVGFASRTAASSSR